MAYFTKRYHPPGTQPGTLIKHEKAESVPLKITLTNYNNTEYSENEVTTLEECKAFLRRDKNLWIHVQGDSEPETLRELGQLFGLHPLTLEDVINTGQRPKVDEYNDQLFIAMAHPRIETANQSVQIEQLSLCMGENFLVSFHPGKNDPLGPVRQRLRDNLGRIRKRGVDYLLYALLDMVIDEGFPVLEWLGDEVEALEEELLEAPGNATLRRLHELKRMLIILRRMLWPQREVLNVLMRDERIFVEDQNQIYYRDCYDHTIQIMDLIETYRDMVTGLLDVYLSSVSFRLNEIMSMLTVVATIFIPLTFITGVYGMNFSNERSPWAMPELHWYFGYPLVWLIMITMVAGMLLYFRRRKWL